VEIVELTRRGGLGKSDLRRFYGAFPLTASAA
jgi:hypothetical protein